MKLPADFSISVCVFLVVVAVHSLSPVSQWGDSRWIIPTAMSIIKEGNTDLDEYKSVIPPDDHTIAPGGNHLYTIFPIGTTALVVPFLFLTETFSSHALRFSIAEELLYAPSMPGLEIFFSSIFVALAAVFMYLISRRLGLNGLPALFVVFIFAFCTSAWSTGSRALWQHGPSMLMLAIALYLTIRAHDNPSLIQFISLPLAFSFVIRPTNSIAIIVFSAFVLIQYRVYFVRFVSWSLVIGAPFLLFNLSVYHSLLSPYYLPGRLGSNPDFLMALAGNMISPGRGLFIFTPVLIFSIVGIILKARRASLTSLDIALCCIIFLHWIAISSFPHWWGGYSFGPRFFSDMTPFLIYFLIPVVALLLSGGQGIKMKAFVALFVLAAGVSFAIHMRGATSNATMFWNRVPLSVDEHPERLWQWNDLQFLSVGDVPSRQKTAGE